MFYFVSTSPTYRDHCGSWCGKQKRTKSVLVLELDFVVNFICSFSSFSYSSSPPSLQSWSWFWQQWAGQYCHSRYDNLDWTKWFSWWNYRFQTYIFPSFLLGFQYFDIPYLARAGHVVKTYSWKFEPEQQ